MVGHSILTSGPENGGTVIGYRMLLLNDRFTKDEVGIVLSQMSILQYIKQSFPYALLCMSLLHFIAQHNILRAGFLENINENSRQHICC